MKIIKKIVFTIYGLAFFFGGIFLITASRGAFLDFPVLIRNLLIKLTPDSMFLAGTVLFIAGLLPGIIKVLEARRSRSVAFDNPDGEVAIALHTIEDFVSRAGMSFPEVIQLKPVINPRRKAGVEIILEVILEEGANIPQLTERIQHQIKTQLQELLGIENIAGIQINVIRIKPRADQAAPQG
jgi:uncharacterized alkaline shock family protein YloU